MTKGFKFFALAALAVGVVGLASCGSDDITNPSSATIPDPLKLTIKLTGVPAAVNGMKYTLVRRVKDATADKAAWSTLNEASGTLKTGDSTIKLTDFYIADLSDWSTAVTGANYTFRIKSPGTAADDWDSTNTILGCTESKNDGGFVFALAGAKLAVTKSQYMNVDCTGLTADVTKTAKDPMVNVPLAKCTVSDDTSYLKPAVDPLTLKIKLTSVPAAVNGMKYTLVRRIKDATADKAAWSALNEASGTLSTGDSTIELTDFYIADLSDWSTAVTGANFTFRIKTPGTAADDWDSTNTILGCTESKNDGGFVFALAGTKLAVTKSQYMNVDCTGVTADVTKTAKVPMVDVTLAKCTVSDDTSWK